MTVKHLITHSGGFHADELLSSVVLTRLFPKAELVRTRVGILDRGSLDVYFSMLTKLLVTCGGRNGYMTYSSLSLR